MKNAKRNWKTTTVGILMLALAGVRIYKNTSSASDPNVLGTVVAGVGLIAAKDGDKTGTAEPKKEAAPE